MITRDSRGPIARLAGLLPGKSCAGRWRRAAGAARHRSGTGLVEMLVASSIGVVVTVATLSVVDLMYRDYGRPISRGDRIQEATVAVGRMTRDLRQAVTINDSGSSWVDMSTYGSVVPGDPIQEMRVLIDCSTGTCTRQAQDESGGLGPPITLLDGVTNPESIFGYSVNVNDGQPEHVRVTLEYGAQADSQDTQRPVSVAAGVHLRNREST